MMIAGAICWSTGGLLVRQLSIHSAWEIVFWRSLFMAAFVAIVLTVMHVRRGLCALLHLGFDEFKRPARIRFGHKIGNQDALVPCRHRNGWRPLEGFEVQLLSHDSSLWPLDRLTGMRTAVVRVGVDRAGELAREQLRDGMTRLRELARSRHFEMRMQGGHVLPLLDEHEGVLLLAVLVEAIAEAAGFLTRGGGDRLAS